MSNTPPSLYTRVSHDFAQPSLLQKLGLESIDEWFYPYLKEKRDVVFVHWTIFLTLLMFPLAYLVVFKFTWYFVILYYVCFARFLGTYLAVLHNCSHTPIYKFGWMDHYLTLVLGWFYGQAPYTYYMHHVKMHHVEGNAENDISCTMNYQRDSVVDFLHYYFRFLWFGIFELFYYFAKKNQWKYAFAAILGEFSYHAAYLSIMYFYSFKVAFFLFVVPLNVTRFFMMSGNWVQHAFINPKDPYSDYNSITCIETQYNIVSLNDGYHASHHLHPKRHWTAHPTHFLDTQKTYQEHQAIVFRDLDYFLIWCRLMTKNYDSLANYVVCLGGEVKTKEQIIAFIKDRVQRIEPKKQ